ncbi:hypothetical protein AOXY_G8823 [Acipenser oxyrinchus oxyrinchus]|uniref:Uncharacterized protein n=1 Tax=Acipenser oxyrinchus oxyrinchus TaxID=40147 RepID=A0AAD8LLW0_ACIOX|nr:hypothetical protein AOXY_G8823 [Acipenser oxyrinchus oxyrinchus]
MTTVWIELITVHRVVVYRVQLPLSDQMVVVHCNRLAPYWGWDAVHTTARAEDLDPPSPGTSTPPAADTRQPAEGTSGNGPTNPLCMDCGRVIFMDGAS